jgi:hypothetical protein
VYNNNKVFLLFKDRKWRLEETVERITQGKEEKKNILRIGWAFYIGCRIVMITRMAFVFASIRSADAEKKEEGVATASDCSTAIGCARPCVG